MPKKLFFIGVARESSFVSGSTIKSMPYFKMQELEIDFALELLNLEKSSSLELSNRTKQKVIRNTSKA